MPGKIRHVASLAHLPRTADNDFGAGRDHGSGSGRLFARGPAPGDLHLKTGAARLLDHLPYRQAQQRWHTQLPGIGYDHRVGWRLRSGLRGLRGGLRGQGRGVAGRRAGILAGRRTCSLHGRRRRLRTCGGLRSRFATQRVVAGQVIGGLVKGLNIFALGSGVVFLDRRFFFRDQGRGAQIDVVRHAEVFQNLLRHFSEDRCGDFGSVVSTLG